MANVIFYLKSTTANSKGELPLIAQIALDYKKYRKPIGKVKKSDWNSRLQRIKIPAIELERNEAENEKKINFNKFLTKIEEKIEKLSSDAILEKRKLTLEEIKEVLTKKDEVPTKKAFKDLFQDFIEANKPDKADRTIKGYVTVLNFLKKFEKEANFPLINSSINHDFVDKLKLYTLTTKKKQNGYFVKIIRVIRTFLHWAKDRNFYDGEIIENTTIKEPEKEVIFLSLDELFTLYNYDFETTRLNDVKDLYCFSAFTGLRFSDLFTLKCEHISKNNIITKVLKKPGVLKSIPLNRYAIEILKKYEELDNPLPLKASQNINYDIKDCLRIIGEKQKPNEGFNRLVIIKKHYGRKEKDESKPLHKAVTFHTARKTFITNSIMLGMNIKVLQDMGAPQKDKDLRKYLKITEAFKQKEIENSWNKVNRSKSGAEVF